ncbi:hypothetical protein G5C66_10585 [Nocardioides sp. KC13]|uniref:Uncharacterized protein n=1 Tax=Nocardioides turkmenicus TaxID=2711220 RepID=A0A6M1QZM3_9ACTN|nr:hypothetical protein [Nocardioides sp. KC13]NGN93180.1 hypothetical protein [Nocardioides sp. KC13]
MPALQTADEIEAILARLHGRSIGALQVLGINSLKSVDPMPDALTGAVVISSQVSGRLLRLTTDGFEVNVDLQRTGRVVWLKVAKPYDMAAGTARPTVRLILEDGDGLDLTEPAKTKRITVRILRRAR